MFRGDGISDRERALAEAWLEDEMLRGDLDDETWQPIQDWLLRTSTRIASATTGLDDTSAQPLLDQARATARAIVGTLADILSPGVPGDQVDGRVEALHDQVGWPVVELDRTSAVHTALRSAADELSHGQVDPPTAARVLTAALDAGLATRSLHDP